MADASFRQEFLRAHNSYRATHHSKMMTMSSELCASAQAWADQLLRDKALQHSQTENGENVFSKWSSAPITPTGNEAVDKWYNEIKDYSWSSPGFTGKTGHFTQVVWNDSTELGVGMATDGNHVYVVGQYRPAGNISGHFESNVFKADGRGDATADTDKPSEGEIPKRSCTLL